MTEIDTTPNAVVAAAVQAATQAAISAEKAAVAAAVVGVNIENIKVNIKEIKDTLKEVSAQYLPRLEFSEYVKVLEKTLDDREIRIRALEKQTDGNEITRKLVYGCVILILTSFFYLVTQK